MEPAPNIVDDFLYELSVAKFPFAKIIKDNDDYLSALKREFSCLETKPKLHLFFSEFISDAKSEVEKKGEKLIAKFQQKVINNTVEEKYYGRLLEDTEMVKLLTKFNSQVESYKKYVFEDLNIDNYSAYAKAFAKSILLLSKQITIPGLMLDLLESVTGTAIDTDITLNIFLFKIAESEQRKIKYRFNILKTLADEIINDEIQALKNNPVNTALLKEYPGNAADSEIPPITLTDRVLRELDMIIAIFESQYSKYDPQQPNTYPTLLGRDGHSGIDGQYIQNIYLSSEVELFGVQKFKEQITQRFEGTSNHVLLNKQLLEIYEKSQVALKYYNEKLTKNNAIVDDFLKWHSGPIAERIDELDKYSAYITVYNYYIGSIYLGVVRGSVDRESFRSTYQRYNYSTNNFTLATVCQDISDFLEKFDLPIVKEHTISDKLADRLDQLDKKYRVKAKITKEEAAGQSNGRFEEGMEGFANPPIPNSATAAFTLFTEYYATRELEVQKSLFFDTYGSMENETAVAAEIKRIEDFIAEADKIDYYQACTDIANPDHRYLFKRLSGGFYQNVRMTWEQLTQNSAAASVYGRYFLFYNYLKENLDRIRKDKVYAQRAIPSLFKDFYGMDGEINLFNTVPFEIAFIYRYAADDVQRFLTVEYGELKFLTDYLSYSSFDGRFRSEEFYDENLTLLDFESLKPYLKSYIRGFFEGYDQFEDNIGGQTKVFGSDSQTIANKVFETITAPLHGLNVSTSQRVGGKRYKIITHHLWFESGKELGSNYKAWFYVINNPQNFTILFKKHEPFISFYNSSLAYWKGELGGEGIADGLNTILMSIGSLTPTMQTESDPNKMEATERDKDSAKIRSRMAAFENNMVAADFDFLVDALLGYFESGSFMQPLAPLKVTGKVNKKKFGWQLHEIYKQFTADKLAIPYLQFAKHHISIFASVGFNEADVKNSNLYKYFTTKMP
jgi:hypothetical protein